MAYTPRSLPPSPPARGSFPLDHAGACKSAMRTYLTCARAHGGAHHLCRDESKAYLQCRMDHNLMTQEDLTTMGFDPAVVVVPGPEALGEGKEIIAGLAAAKRRKMGVLFGFGSGAEEPARRGGGH